MSSSDHLNIDKEKKRAIELFKQTEKMASVGGWEYDIGSGEMYYSDQVYRIHEIPIGEKIEINKAIDFYEDEAKVTIRKAVEGAMATGERYDLELPFITATGRKIFVRACGEGVIENGKVVRLVGAFQDITLTRLKEDFHNKRLKEVEYARELIQNQAKELELQKDRAEEAAKIKGQFLANISHEIRTPLHGVLGMTELLLETELKDEQLEFAKNIQSSATHLLTTIEDILQFSGIEAKKASLSLGSVNLQEFLEEIPLVFTRAIQERDIIYVEVFDPVLEYLNVDKSKLRQVLINILGNAFKFADKGGAIVHQARLVSETNDEVIVKFAVTDTGPGISPNELDKIFQPFYQVDNSSTREHGGTGLGLAISHELVRLMGGELKVKSRVDCGACFFFTLSFKKSDPVSLKLGDSEEITIDSFDGKATLPLNILVAEDMIVNQKIIALQLEKRGHRLTFANDGIQALDFYKNSQFDLILMDINMPKMSGDQVAASIRALELGTDKHIPIIACTAHLVPEDVSLYLKMGIDSYLSKPVKRADLIKAVEKIKD